MDPRSGPNPDDGLTDEERATLAAGGRLVTDQQDAEEDKAAPRIEGPNPS